MAKNEQLEKVQQRATAQAKRAELAEKAARSLKSLSSKLGEQALKLEQRGKQMAARVSERDSVERTLLVSVVSNVAAGATTVGANALIQWVAAKWPWLAARVDYAKGVPHLLLGYGGAILEVSTRGKGLVSLEREITYRALETFGTIGAVRVGEAILNRSKAEKAQVQQALAQARAAQAQAQARGQG